MDLKTNGMLASYDFSEVGITDGLVGWWPLNGNANDITVNGNDGTVSGATVSSGLDSLCYSFDGVDDVITLPANIGYTTTFSALAWFKSLGAPLNGYHIVLGPSAMEISIPASTGALRIGVECGGRMVSDFGSGLTNGNWHFVSSIFTGTELKGYIDGVYIGQITGISGTLTYNFARRIGQFSGGNDYVTNGLIQDVRIYNRALSAEEIKIQYELTKNKVMNIDSTGKLYTAGKIIETY